MYASHYITTLYAQERVADLHREAAETPLRSPTAAGGGGRRLCLRWGQRIALRFTHVKDAGR